MTRIAESRKKDNLQNMKMDEDVPDDYTTGGVQCLGNKVPWEQRQEEN